MGWCGRRPRGSAASSIPDVTRARHEATQTALARLSRILADTAPDVLVVIGDDQGEWFSADGQPALCIYWGDAVENLPPPVERMAPSIRSAYWGFYGDGTNRTFPIDAALGRHLVETLTRDHEFDVAHLRVQPRHGPFGHAWSFVHQRLMGDRVVPIVPVLLNTYYPPNQPTPRRCYRLGKAIREAIEDLAVEPTCRDRRLGRAEPLRRRRGARSTRPRDPRQEGRGSGGRIAAREPRLRQLRDSQLDRDGGRRRASSYGARRLCPELSIRSRHRRRDGLCRVALASRERQTVPG